MLHCQVACNLSAFSPAGGRKRVPFLMEATSQEPLTPKELQRIRSSEIWTQRSETSDPAAAAAQLVCGGTSSGLSRLVLDQATGIRILTSVMVTAGS